MADSTLSAVESFSIEREDPIVQGARLAKDSATMDAARIDGGPPVDRADCIPSTNRAHGRQDDDATIPCPETFSAIFRAAGTRAMERSGTCGR
jgi:hypothetical protein